MTTTGRPPDEPRGNLLTLGEVAEMCHVDYRTAHKWAMAGALGPVLRVGPDHAIRVYRRDVERQIRVQQV